MWINQKHPIMRENSTCNQRVKNSMLVYILPTIPNISLIRYRYDLQCTTLINSTMNIYYFNQIENKVIRQIFFRIKLVITFL
jgi:hypothetical protein